MWKLPESESEDSSEWPRADISICSKKKMSSKNKIETNRQIGSDS